MAYWGSNKKLKRVLLDNDKKLKEFNDKKNTIKKNQVIKKFQRASSNFLLESSKNTYNFTWMGVQ